MEATEKSLSYNEEPNPYRRITRRIDSMRIRHNQKRDLDVNISFAKDMNVNKEIAVRAGAIIYTHKNGETLFCLGIDTHSGNITDFGGGVKKEETIIEGGLRELEEESQSVFGTLTPKDVEDSVIFHCYNMAIMFIPMDVDPTSISNTFKKNVANCPEPEVCGIVWLTTKELLESIHGRGNKMYVRVRRLLNKVTTTISEL